MYAKFLLFQKKLFFSTNSEFFGFRAFFGFCECCALYQSRRTEGFSSFLHGHFDFIYSTTQRVVCNCSELISQQIGQRKTDKKLDEMNDM